MKNRKGKLRISRTFIENDIEVVQLIFSVFIPIYIINNGFDTFIEYHGYSNNFDLLIEGDEIPFYGCIIVDDNGVSKFKEFIRL